MPRVSIVIPNFNHGRFLEKRILSVRNQTYQDFEVIYLDDASTDDSDQVIGKHLCDSRIRVIRNEANSGSPCKQWNKGVRLAKGEYVWIAESDDYADEKFLATLVQVMDDNPTVGLAYCQSTRVDEEDCPLTATEDFLRGEGHWSNNFVNDGKEECRSYLASRNTIPNASAVLIRRRAYEEAGYADETMRLCGDWLMWIKILLVSDVAFVAERLNYYRTNANSVRYQTSHRGTYHEEAYQVVRYAMEKISIPTEALEETCQTLAGGWVSSIVRRRTLRPWRQTRMIYRNASAVDHRLKSRLIKNVASTIAQSFYA